VKNPQYFRRREEPTVLPAPASTTVAIDSVERRGTSTIAGRHLDVLLAASVLPPGGPLSMCSAGLTDRRQADALSPVGRHLDVFLPSLVTRQTVEADQ